MKVIEPISMEIQCSEVRMENTCVYVCCISPYTPPICILTYTWFGVRVPLYLHMYSMTTYIIPYLWYVQYVAVSFYVLMSSRITYYMFFGSVYCTVLLLNYQSRCISFTCTDMYDLLIFKILIHTCLHKIGFNSSLPLRKCSQF